jgi:hypothetical protein
MMVPTISIIPELDFAMSKVGKQGLLISVIVEDRLLIIIIRPGKMFVPGLHD